MRTLDDEEVNEFFASTRDVILRLLCNKNEQFLSLVALFLFYPTNIELLSVLLNLTDSISSSLLLIESAAILVF